MISNEINLWYYFLNEIAIENIVLNLENLEEESEVKENPLDQVLVEGMRAVINWLLEEMEDESNPPPTWSFLEAALYLFCFQQDISSKKTIPT